MCVTPSDLSAQMFARYGTVDGLRRCPSPWRERSATRCPSSSASVIGPEGAAERRLDLADLARAERAERLAEPRSADHPDDAASHAPLPPPGGGRPSGEGAESTAALPSTGCPLREGPKKKKPAGE